MYGPKGVHETIDELLQGPPEAVTHRTHHSTVGAKAFHTARQLDDAVEVIRPTDAQSRRRLKAETGDQSSQGENKGPEQIYIYI